MTNAEKFREVFGLKMDDTSDCGFFDCTDRRSCEDCPVKDTKAWWNAEYKENEMDKFERLNLEYFYETRLKAEKIAMLTEILLEIEQCGVEDSHWIIKQKINSLKENKDE